MRAKVKEEEEEVEQESLKVGKSFSHRLVITAEVAVSKIFPAGFGWQAFSCIADAQLGLQADSTGFALVTGVGDATGVFIGHTTYFAMKQLATGDDSIDMGEQIQVAALLATAAFHAGTAWQPIVNFLHEQANCTFNQTLGGTMLGCGLMFFVGLRVGRGLYSSFMPAVAAPAYDNLKTDASLSVAIGGATACFVGTDVSFVVNGVETNWLRPLVGIEEGTSDLFGMATAGSSTAIGFTALQMCQNVACPAGKNWVD